MNWLMAVSGLVVAGCSVPEYKPLPPEDDSGAAAGQGGVIGGGGSSAGGTGATGGSPGGGGGGAGGTGAAPGCVPGTIQSGCSCPGGLKGTQTCGPDGKFRGCKCDYQIQPGGPCGQLVSATTTCSQCFEKACCTDGAACVGNVECECIFDNYVGGGLTLTSAKSLCKSYGTPDGPSLFDALAACIKGQCPECG